jgi:hypothetical protein
VTKTKSKGRRRYVNGDTVPKRIRKDRVLMHNQVRHSRTMEHSENGFRAWTDTKPWRGFKWCGCGWSGLPHYSGFPDYKCEPRSRLPR